MASTVTIDLRHVARGLSIPVRQVQAVVELLDEGNTVPFITRYRKDQTGGLDEEQIRQIQGRLAKMRLLADRKQTILRSIESQGKLSEDLAKQILSAGTTKRLEDLYLPYKPKKQTLATQARSRGLEPLAREIFEGDPVCADLDARAADFANPDRQVPTSADALLGAGHILAEQISEQVELRQRLREILQRTGKFVTTQIAAEGNGQGKKAESKPPAIEPDSPNSRGEGTPNASVEEKAPAADPPHEEKPPEGPDTGGNPGQGTNLTGPPPDASPQPPSEPPSEPATELPSEPPGDAPSESPNEPPDEAPSEPSSESPSDTAEQPAVDTTAEQQPDDTAAQSPVDAAAEQPPETAAEVHPEPPSPAAEKPPPSTAKALPKRAKPKPRLSKRELKKKQAEEKKIKAFRDYFDYREEIRKIPPHRVLAINRGERAKVLRVKIESDLEAMHQALDELLVPPEHPHPEYLRGCARDSLGRLILPSLEREIRRELTDRAETHAVEVFAKNLRNLLVQPPIHGRRVLAVDPGYKSGCKLAALDQFGNLLDQGVIYLVGRPQRREEARRKVDDLIRRFGLSVIVIGNGTACRECEDFFAELMSAALKDLDVSYVIVNEAGASVYSTSRIGREEFPEYDASLRGAISIGRRLLDPLSELVKIDAANIGVGLYQHDVKAKHLRSSLDEVVESCVNYVGVDANTASPALLRYVSGLNQLTARRIYEYRRQHGPFRSREQFREVPGLGEATFVQAAGFLKIAGGENPLDATWIHPESYEVAGRVLEKLQCAPTDLIDKEKSGALAERIPQLEQEEMAEELAVGLLTLNDILAQLARPGRDPREDLPAPVFKRGVLKLEDLSPGMELTGAVLNVVDFGAFVDIGMHDSGLVHVSQLADRYIRDPHEAVAVGDIVKVWVLGVDKERRRVSLTMIQPGSERPRRPRHGEKPDDQKARTPRDGSRDGKHDGKRDGKQAKERESRRPKGKRPPKSREASRRGGPPKPKFRPKSRPKPVVPITDAMRSGKEPMRTFGDLTQFFSGQKVEAKDDRQGEKDEKPTEEIKQIETPPAPAEEKTPQTPETSETTPPEAETMSTEVQAEEVRPDGEQEKTQSASDPGPSTQDEESGPEQ